MLRNEIVGSRSARHSNTTTVSNKVLVAVKAERVISNTALAWALTHVVHSSDSITLLAVYSAEKTGRRFWSFSKLTGDCSSSREGKLPERISDISESCSQMILQLQNQIEVRVKIKVVTGTPSGAVAAEARWSGSQWVILDKKLKQEVKHCMDELQCSIVVMNGSHPKILRLNLECSDELQTPFYSAASSPGIEIGKLKDYRLKHSTPVSSPEEAGTSVTRTIGVNSVSSSDSVTSLFLVYKQNPLYEGQGPQKRTHKPIYDLKDSFNVQPPLYFDLERDTSPTSWAHPTPSSVSSDNKNVFWTPQNHIMNEKLKKPENKTTIQRTKSPNSKTLLENFIHCDQERRTNELGFNFNHDQSRSYVNNSCSRDNTIPLGRTCSIPPPLCSRCQNKAPLFGKPPRRFLYDELEEATDMFSDVNFIAEGGFGVVHKGMLRDGQVIAVKQLKFSGSQADLDFCREVRLLSCAQHRNIVLLIGFCTEGNLRILVYEYVCNGSLDLYLQGESMLLDCNSRLRIAIGVARGLRYLHEDCRVGSIVHRDLRPKNILLTHDFEPLVADFGLARWHTEWNINTEDRVIGASGYLAPEYLEAGNLTYKVDVYAFGIVLLELITGCRICDLERFNGHCFLSEWFHPLRMLEPNHILENVRSLNTCFDSKTSLEFNLPLQAMARAASLCLRLDPDARPPMSKILIVLEGGDPIRPMGLDFNSVGNTSGHLRGLTSHAPPKGTISHSRGLSH
ncbi:PREDICTED: inactive protein kinase SELMODRAFT_444075-like isoform X1 [Lupinus angustifolius]|uniref:inactive protein kinase SELMODRAFT_444075-like isoform X1 n=2 Tax=Lupinus angustifolius TaxID=3871 RepID=UPI00092F3721|nr:PREDICTED: inactive protein kinase SELMODRAFT_444075-like isoform X1 [Lupinus angustifolius]